MNSAKRTRSNDQSEWHDLEQGDHDPLLDYDDRDSSSSESNDENLLDENSIESAFRSLDASSSERDYVNVR